MFKTGGQELPRMSSTRIVRILLIGCLVGAMILSLAPAGVSKENKSSRCPRFDPVEPKSDSEQTGEVPKAKVLSVRDEATRDDPLLIELDFGVALWGPAPSDPTGPEVPIVEDTQFFNLQVDTKRQVVALNAKVVWDSPGQLDDFDAYLYNSKGSEVARDSDGLGDLVSTERVSFSARTCDGFTVEARAYRTLPRSATLQIWLQARG